MTGYWIDNNNSPIKINGLVLSIPAIYGASSPLIPSNTHIVTYRGNGNYLFQNYSDASRSRVTDTETANISSDGNTLSWSGGYVWNLMPAGYSGADGSSSGVMGEYGVNIGEQFNAAGSPAINMNGQWYDSNYNLVTIKNGIVTGGSGVQGKPVNATNTKVVWANKTGKISGNHDTVIWGDKSRWVTLAHSTKPSKALIVMFKQFMSGNAAVKNKYRKQLRAAKMIDANDKVNLHAHNN